ncbi:MAG: bile acid:sodium symporter family protein [Planctomycetaceae bacterium]
MHHVLTVVPRASLAVAAAAALLADTGWVAGRPDVWQPAAVVAAVAAAIGCRAIPALVTYQFTVWVLVTVVIGMLYPQQCLSMGGLDMKNKHLLTGMIQLVMFGMGTQMTIAELSSVQRMSYPLVIGILLQFSVMPVVGWGIATALGMPPEIAAGVVLIGACSSGLASNVMSYIAEANLPLSLALTAIGTVTAPVTTPFWMWLLAGTWTAIDVVGMMMDIVKIVIVPVGAALLHDWLRHASPAARRTLVAASLIALGAAVGTWCAGLWSLPLTDAGEPTRPALLAIYAAGAVLVGLGYHSLWRLWPAVERWMPAAAMFGILFVTLITIAKGRGQLMDLGVELFVASVLHNVVGLALGYAICRLSRVDERSSRTIAMEVGIQNGGMASGLANEMGKIDTVGLAAAVFIPWMNISGSLLANYWRRRGVVDD